MESTLKGKSTFLLGRKPFDEEDINVLQESPPLQGIPYTEFNVESIVMFGVQRQRENMQFSFACALGSLLMHTQ